MNEKQIFSYLISKGYKPHEVLGIMGNLQEESGLKPNLYGDSGKAYGLAQWHPDRRQKFKNKYGKDMIGSSVKEQLDFLDYELKTHEPKTFVSLKKSKNIEGATRAFAKFERFKGYENPNDSNYTRRINHAKKHHNAFKKGGVSMQSNNKTMDPEIIKILKLDAVPQYSTSTHRKETLKKNFEAFEIGRNWVKKKYPDQEKAFVKFYADKGYITRDKDGDPDGPFNKIIIDEKRAEAKKANKDFSSPEKKEVQELFNIVNNLQSKTGSTFFDGISYDTDKNGKTIFKDSTFDAAKMFDEKELKLLNKIMKPYDKAKGRSWIDKKTNRSNQKSGETFISNDADAKRYGTTYNVKDFFKAVQDNVNPYLPEGEKINLINHKTGERGKDLAVDVSKLAQGVGLLQGGIGSNGKGISSNSLYIPDLKGDKDNPRKLVPKLDTMDSSGIDYIDPGYDDVEETSEYDYEDWGAAEDSAYPDPSKPNAERFSYKEFEYLDAVVKNSPEYDKFKKDSKLSAEQKKAEYDKIFEQKANEYEVSRDKGDLNSYLTQVDNLANSLPEQANKGYNADTQKGEGFDFLGAASSMFGILNGAQMSKEELPERDEQVSFLFQDFTAQVKKLSEIGLKPEDEAYAKNQIAEATQGSLEMITRASNGNRNLVLGNLGRVDYQKQKSLMDLAVLDNRIKTENLFKYGEAVKYISEFDANRDIANKQNEYQQANATKQAGAQLASAGWASLMDNIQYYKENKPGSANAMLKTHYQRQWYDVDYNEKDPTNYYHPDNHAKRVAETETYRQNVTQVNETLKSLSEEDQKLFQKFQQKTGFDFNAKSTIDMIEFLKNNPGDKGNMDLNKIQEAANAGNYSVLFDKMDSTQPIDPAVQASLNPAEMENKLGVTQSSMPTVSPEIKKAENIQNPNEKFVDPFTLPKVPGAEPNWNNSPPQNSNQNPNNSFLSSGNDNQFNSMDYLEKSGIFENELVDKYSKQNYNFL